MTVNEMILEVWQMIGEPADIDPTDGTADPTTANIDTGTNGYTRILRALNEAQIRVATYRQPRGRMFRWEGGYAGAAVTATPSTTTLDTDITVGDLTLSTGLSGAADDWNGWMIRIGSDVKRVVDSTADGDLTVADPFDTAYASGTTVTLIESPIAMPSDVWLIARVTDGANQSDLKPSIRTKDMLYGAPGDSAPGFYWRQGQNLYLDSAEFDETRTYTVLYQRLPLAMSASQESELPDNFHWALVLWAAGWGYWRQQDPNERKNIRDDFADFMRQTVMESMREYDHTELSGQVREDY